MVYCTLDKLSPQIFFLQSSSPSWSVLCIFCISEFRVIYIFFHSSKIIVRGRSIIKSSSVVIPADVVSVKAVIHVVVQGVVASGRVRLLARSRFQSRSRSMLPLGHRLAVVVWCHRQSCCIVWPCCMCWMLGPWTYTCVHSVSIDLQVQFQFQGFSIPFMWPCCMSSMLGPWTTRVHTRTFVIRLSCCRPRTRSRVPCTAHTNLSDAIAFSDDHTDVHVTHSKSWSIVSFSIPLSCNHCQCPLILDVSRSVYIRCQCLSMLHIQSRGPLCHSRSHPRRHFYVSVCWLCTEINYRDKSVMTASLEFQLASGPLFHSYIIIKIFTVIWDEGLGGRGNEMNRWKIGCLWGVMRHESGQRRNVRASVRNW